MSRTRPAKHKEDPHKNSLDTLEFLGILLGSEVHDDTTYASHQSVASVLTAGSARPTDAAREDPVLFRVERSGGGPPQVRTSLQVMV